jgi:hypothetical protein
MRARGELNDTLLRMEKHMLFRRTYTSGEAFAERKFK